jgi:O-antigen/teichoic acid export membrane protein
MATLGRRMAHVDTPEREDPGRAPITRRRILGSALWATGQQVVLLGVNAVFGVVLARTLTVADFGVYSYAIALAGMGMALVAGGLSGLAIKALLDDDQREARTLTALIVIRESFAVVAYAVLLVIALATSGSDVANGAAAIALLVLFARAWDAIEFWFQAHLESRRSAGVRMAVALAMLAVRLGALLAGAKLWMFLGLYVLESCLIAIGLVVRYRLDERSPGFRKPSVSAARDLLGHSWLLLLSSVASQVNLKSDQLFLQALVGSAAVGTYAAAARLSELSYFLPAVFMTATFPALLDVRKRQGGESVEYRAMLQRSYDQACWAGVALMMLIVAVGPIVIDVVYGDRYEPAAGVLQIHVLALPFVFMAAVFSKWILAEGLLVASLIRHVFGALLNVVLNLLLIPTHGIRGAAVATVCSYTAASYLACFVGRATRPAGIQMTRALFAPLRLAGHLRRRAG